MFVILCRARDGVDIFHDVIVYFISLSAENEFISINYIDVSVGKLVNLYELKTLGSLNLNLNKISGSKPDTLGK